MDGRCEHELMVTMVLSEVALRCLVAAAEVALVDLLGEDHPDHEDHQVLKLIALEAVQDTGGVGTLGEILNDITDLMADGLGL